MPFNGYHAQNSATKNLTKKLISLQDYRTHVFFTLTSIVTAFIPLATIRHHALSLMSKNSFTRFLSSAKIFSQTQHTVQSDVELEPLPGAECVSSTQNVFTCADIVVNDKPADIFYLTMRTASSGLHLACPQRPLAANQRTLKALVKCEKRKAFGMLQPRHNFVYSNVWDATTMGMPASDGRVGDKQIVHQIILLERLLSECAFTLL